MHTAPPSFATPLRWHSRPQQVWRDLPPEIADWLLDSGSLTQRLCRASAGRFRVCVLHEGWTRPDRDEARILGLRLAARAWTREVQLLGDDQPWVFARTLIPARTLSGRGRRLTRLGTRPLGQALFADPDVRRGPIEIMRIAVGQRLHQRALTHLVAPPGVVWGRRSVFRIEDRPLLVCEIFLPDLPVFACY